MCIKELLRPLVMAEHFCKEENCSLCMSSIQTAQKLIVEKFTSTNNARDEICSKNICSYCRNICICQGNAEFPKCFDGNKLSPVA